MSLSGYKGVRLHSYITSASNSQDLYLPIDVLMVLGEVGCGCTWDSNTLACVKIRSSGYIFFEGKNAIGSRSYSIVYGVK